MQSLSRYVPHTCVSTLLRVLLLLIMLASAWPTHGQGTEATAKTPMIDLSSWNFEEEGLAQLHGQWHLYPDQLLDPETFHQEQDSGIADQVYAFSVPGEMDPSTANEVGMENQGRATLHLRVITDGLPRVYGLTFRYFASANDIWVNGEYLGGAGHVGLTKDGFIPHYLPQEVFFYDDTGQLDIVLHVANFHHRRIRFSEVNFGLASDIQQHVQGGIAWESMLLGSLLIMAIYYAILHYIQRRDPASLYLAAIALMSLFRVGITSQRVLIRLIPHISGEWTMKLGYIPAFVNLPLLALYIREIVRVPALDTPARLSKWVVVVLAVFVIATPLHVYDQAFQYAQILVLVFSIYLIYVVVRYGFMKKVRGTWAMGIGTGILLAAAANDMMREYTIINTPEMVSPATVIFIMIQALFLAWRYNDAYLNTIALARENQQMVEHIQGMNLELENKVEKRTVELKEANKKLRAISNTDGLTGASNRRYFDSQLQVEWKRALRQGTPLSVIMCDVDHFKDYNDHYGHPKGDQCLVNVVQVIRRQLNREGDLLARYGGEEFVVLLPNTPREGACKVAERIRREMENLAILHAYSAAASVVTLSLGVAGGQVSEAFSAEKLVEKADQALYQAKKTGRNKVSCDGNEL